MFTEIRDPADELETSLNADGLVSRGPANGLETSPNYAHGDVFSLLKLGVLRTAWKLVLIRLG